MTKHALKPLCAAALMLFLLSCAAPSPRIGKDTTIGNQRGVVALTVQNNVIAEDLLSSFLFEWKRAFIVRQGKDKMRIEMVARKEGMRDSIVFFAEVQPGTYTLDLLTTLVGYGTYYEQRFPVEEHTFTVKANTVTNLGTLITAISPKGGFSRDARILRGFLPSEPEMQDYLGGAFPRIAEQQAGRPFETWVKPDVIAKTSELANRIRRFSTAMTSPVRAKDGTHYAGAPMGIVWRRTAQGEWTSLDTGYAREITALGTQAGGGLLAAAEGGVVLRSTDRGETWKGLGPLPSYGIVLALGEFAPGRLYALVKGEGAVEFLQAAAPEGPWTKAAALTASPEARGSSDTLQASVTAAGPRLAVVLNRRDLRVYDSATGAWTAQLLPGDVQREAGFEDGTLYVGHRTRQYLPQDPKAAKAKGFGGKKDEKQDDPAAILRKSVDGGVTWTDVEAFDSDKQGYSFFSPARILRKTDVALEGGATPVEQDLAFSSDGGKTWADYPRGKRYYLPSQGSVAGDKLLLFYGLNAVASPDQGKTWRREEFKFPKYDSEPGK